MLSIRARAVGTEQYELYDAGPTFLEVIVSVYYPYPDEKDMSNPKLLFQGDFTFSHGTLQE